MSNLLFVDWRMLLLGEEEWLFLAETMIRTFVMFFVVLLGLTILGKRGVKQLSVFELVVIVGLGSAAGDPMFYKDVGLLPALVVFIMVITMYVFVTKLVGKSKRVEHLLEGKPVCLIQDGRFAISNFKKEDFAQDEFFAELRLKSISHLGQVEQAIIETNGQVSIYFYEDNDVKWGLPILPGILETQLKKIEEQEFYSCSFCGYTEKLEPQKHHTCKVCKKDLWVKASTRKRIK